MKVYYKFYDLTPLREFNRLETQSSKRGVHLKVDLRRDHSFADFFSHPALGDISLEEFLQNFKYGNDEISKKTLHFLLHDAKNRYEALKTPLPFKNHSLWTSAAESESSVLKYKLKSEDDFSFLALIKNKKVIRLDANALFTKDSYHSFIKKIDPLCLPFIEFIEDPFIGDWKESSPIKFASDFIDNPDHKVKIYKPNREFKPRTLKPTIYSSYMGSQLGQWHAYMELINSGDLTLCHGIHVDHFYEKDLFNKKSLDTFFPDTQQVKKIYDELISSSWKLLCSL